MNVRVVLFAKPRELVGQPNVDLALPAGATAADAWSQLSTRYDLGPLPRSFRCAVNSEYAGWEDKLRDGDELAVIPPVSGGAVGERRGVVAGGASPGGASSVRGRGLRAKLKRSGPTGTREIYPEGGAGRDARPWGLPAISGIEYAATRE